MLNMLGFTVVRMEERTENFLVFWESLTIWASVLNPDSVFFGRENTGISSGESFAELLLKVRGAVCFSSVPEEELF